VTQARLVPGLDVASDAHALRDRFAMLQGPREAPNHGENAMCSNFSGLEREAIFTVYKPVVFGVRVA